MLSLFRAITQFNIVVGKYAAWLIVPLFFFLLADVVMRYIVGSAAIWTAELAQLIFGVYSIIAGGYLLVDRAHVNVDIIYGALPVKRKAIIDLATSFMFYIFMAVLIYQSIDMAWESVEKLESSYSVWNPYIWPVKVMIPVAAILLFLQGIVRTVSDVRTVMGLENDPAIFGKQATDGPAH